jgi:hypothetical protein
MIEQQNEYLSASAIRVRYDISPLTLWRWTRDPKLCFPIPLVINRRRFFKRAEIEAWERDRIRLSQVVSGAHCHV